MTKPTIIAAFGNKCAPASNVIRFPVKGLSVVIWGQK